MNFLAAFLLLVTGYDEERSFWLLSSIIERILPTFFEPSLMGLLDSVRCFRELVKLHAPRIHDTLSSFGLDASFRAPSWFLCLFFTALRPAVVARVWDCVFLAAAPYGGLGHSGGEFPRATVSEGR